MPLALEPSPYWMTQDSPERRLDVVELFGLYSVWPSTWDGYVSVERTQLETMGG